MRRDASRFLPFTNAWANGKTRKGQLCILVRLIKIITVIGSSASNINCAGLFPGIEVRALRRQIIPDVVNGQDLAALSKTATVLDAARLMSTRSINSILVMDGDVLEGIFTARDLARRVIAADLSLDTLLGDAMTPDPQTIGPTETSIVALRRMFEGGFRHLPVVADGKVLGVISRRDLFRDEKELIDQ